jgi:hypothetical protein
MNPVQDCNTKARRVNNSCKDKKPFWLYLLFCKILEKNTDSRVEKLSAVSHQLSASIALAES